jgi:hypothetical protein
MGRTTLQLADGTTVELIEWEDFYATATGVVLGPTYEVLLLEADKFPEQQMVIKGFKVDSDLPHEVLAQLELRVFVSHRSYVYPCSAFDRAPPMVTVEKIPKGDEFELVVRSVPSLLLVPLLKPKGANVRVYLRGRDGLQFSPAAATVTLIGVMETPEPGVI